MRSAVQLGSGGPRRAALGLLLPCALCLLGCDAYDARLLPRMQNPSPFIDAGNTDGGGAGGNPDGDGGEDDGGGEPCPHLPEQCNQIDDDCDGRVDEDADMACEMTVLNAEARCGVAEDGPRCVMLSCHDGYDNCDGNPANGCEPYCLCNVCDDAGIEDGGF